MDWDGQTVLITWIGGHMNNTLFGPAHEAAGGQGLELRVIDTPGFRTRSRARVHSPRIFAGLGSSRLASSKSSNQALSPAICHLGTTVEWPPLGVPMTRSLHGSSARSRRLMTGAGTRRIEAVRFGNVRATSPGNVAEPRKRMQESRRLQNELATPRLDTGPPTLISSSNTTLVDIE